MHRTYKSEGVVLKRRNAGEGDRVVTIFTKHHGKIVAVAKGVRKISSRRAGSLEPATQAVFFLVKSKTFDIITQTQLISSFTQARKSLSRLTQVSQMLEIIDLLTREHQSLPQVYEILVNTLSALDSNGSKRGLIVQNVRKILETLGFGLPSDNSESSLKHFIEEITDRELRSKKMLMD